MTAFKDDTEPEPERDSFSRVFGDGRGAPPERPGFCSQPAERSPLERLREFTNDLVRSDGAGEPEQLAEAHGFALIAGKMARSRGDAPVYFLHNDGADGNPTVRALVVTYPGRRPGTVCRGVLFTFDSEAAS
jgi:hypothetical protein